MVILKPGDRVNCRLKGIEIVSANHDYDETKAFEIVAVGEYGYYLFVPVYYTVKDTVPIDKYRLNKLMIDDRFLGEDMVYIGEDMVYQVVQQLDGLNCSSCREFFPMAIANQEDDTLVCYTCRQDPMYKLKHNSYR